MMNTLLEKLKKNNIKIALSGDNLQVQFGGAVDEQLVQELRDHKQSLITFLKETAGRSSLDAIQPVPEREAYPITPGQYRLWVLSQLADASLAYNVPSILQLNQPVQPGLFSEALQLVVARHEILRTVFREDPATQEVQQVIRPVDDLHIALRYIDLRGTAGSKAYANEYLRKDAALSFDLANGPLLRAALIQLEEAQFIFYYNLHHIICDGWSLKVFRKDLLTCYQALLHQQEMQPLLQIQYKDFASWQLDYIASRHTACHDYWMRSFNGHLPVLELPSGKTRPPIKTYNGAEKRFVLDKTIMDGLKKLAAENNATLFMLLLSVVKVLLYRYSGQTDMIIGIPISGRYHASLENQIGFYINTLALRTRFAGDDSFLALLEKVKTVVMGAFTHQQYPFDQLVQDLDIKNDLSRSPLFDVMVVLQNNDLQQHTESLAGNNGNGTVVDIPITFAQFDLRFSFKEFTDALALNIQYNTDIYEAGFITQIGERITRLCRSVILQPEQDITSCKYISAAEELQLVHLFNNTGIPAEDNRSLITFFREQVMATPDKPALQTGNKIISYEELEKCSNQLAHYLQEQYRLTPETLVGILLPRSEWWIISMLGILKAGAAFVPMSVDFPKERIDYISADSQCSAIIDEAVLQDFTGSQAMYSDTPIGQDIKPSQLVYVIYTSGSTGVPKGVMVEHHSLVSFISNFMRLPALENTASIAATTAFTFDISMLEVWLALCSGKRLVLFNESLLADPRALQHALQDSGVEAVQFTPSRLKQLWLLQEPFPASIKLVLVGGEALSEVLFDWLRANIPSAINVYGPTETTVYSSALMLHEASRLSIGKPLAHEQLYILDSKQAVVPVGIPGEIYIGGAGVARGYWNRPALTQERFIPDPFREGGRLYRTGDQGKWLPDGNIEYIGRLDDQVKVRGYRIEPGEITAVLIKHPEVASAVVVVKELFEEEKELVAYFTAGHEVNTKRLKSYLKERLPDYMVPAYYIQLAALPLNNSGKVNRNALPDPGAETAALTKVYAAPATTAEKVLALAWSSVLKITHAGRYDNFFDLGGNSIRSIRLVSALKTHGYYLEVMDILKYQELHNMAMHMQPLSAPVHVAAGFAKQMIYSTTTENQFFEISLHQQRYIAGDELLSSHGLTGPGIITPFDKERLLHAYERLLVLFPILRINLKNEGSEIMQKIVPIKDFRQDIIFMEATEDNLEEVLLSLMEYLKKPFTLSDEQFVRCGVVHNEQAAMIYICLHHIITDEDSNNLLLQCLADLYKDEAAAVSIIKQYPSYFDYTAWQQQFLQTGTARTHLQYWQRHLCNDLKHNSIIQTASLHAKESIVLEGALFDAVKNYCKEQHLYMSAFLLTALCLVAYEVTGQEDVIVIILSKNRDQDIPGMDISKVVGVVADGAPVRITPDVSLSLQAFCRYVTETFMDGRLHQPVPLQEIRKRFQETCGVPLETVMAGIMNYQERPEQFVPAVQPVNTAARVKDTQQQQGFSFTAICYENALKLELHYIPGAMQLLTGWMHRLLDAPQSPIATWKPAKKSSDVDTILN